MRLYRHRIHICSDRALCRYRGSILFCDYHRYFLFGRCISERASQGFDDSAECPGPYQHGVHRISKRGHKTEKTIASVRLPIVLSKNLSGDTNDTCHTQKPVGSSDLSEPVQISDIFETKQSIYIELTFRCRTGRHQLSR